MSVSAPVLTASLAGRCAHGGLATALATAPRVTVGGEPVALAGAGFVVHGCPLQPPAALPCIGGRWVAGSQRVLAGGVPLALATSPAVTLPSGLPLLPAPGSSRVRAV